MNAVLRKFLFAPVLGSWFPQSCLSSPKKTQKKQEREGVRGEASRLVAVLGNCEGTNWHLLAQSSIPSIRTRHTLPKGTILHAAEDSTTGLTQVGTVLENSCNLLERFRAGPGPNQDLLASPCSQPRVTRVQKSCIPGPASSAYAIFWGALLLVCERLIDHAEILHRIWYSWVWDGAHLDGSCSQHPATTHGIFQFQSAASYTWYMVVSKPYSPTSRSLRKRQTSPFGCREHRLAAHPRCEFQFVTRAVLITISLYKHSHRQHFAHEKSTERK